MRLFTAIVKIKGTGFSRQGCENTSYSPVKEERFRRVENIKYTHHKKENNQNTFEPQNPYLVHTQIYMRILCCLL